MRPRLHFTAAQGWLNDPHGLTYHDGVYHLFHQAVPGSLEWRPHCSWGHATSPDLLTWSHRAAALSPGDGDDGVWSGTLVVDDDRARILYTSVSHPELGVGRVRVASPASDAWDAWTKGDVVARAPAGLDLVAFRDPFVRREAGGWRMFVGAGSRDEVAMVLTYTSTDLESWEYDGVAASRSSHDTEPSWTGAVWECPQLVEVDGHWVLIVSVLGDDVIQHVGYGIGGRDSYREGRFTPSDWQPLVFGESYYAPSLFRDRDGRPSLVFWMRDVGDEAEGWTGCLSMPCLVSARGGRLVLEPHPEVTARRGRPVAAGEVSSTLDLEWTPAADGDELILDSEEGPSASIRVAHGLVSLVRPGHDSWSMPWSGSALRVVVDGPVLEICCPDGVLGGAIAPATTWRPVSGRATAWELQPV
ncbi:MAG: glycoside hydrolase family 32 protein [Nocardioides sp.]